LPPEVQQDQDLLLHWYCNMGCCNSYRQPKTYQFSLSLLAQFSSQWHQNQDFPGSPSHWWTGLAPSHWSLFFWWYQLLSRRRRKASC